MVSIPGLGRSPGEGNGNPLQYSCLENPVERGAWCRLQSMGSQRLGHDLSDQTVTSLWKETKHPGGFSITHLGLELVSYASSLWPASLLCSPLNYNNCSHVCTMQTKETPECSLTIKCWTQSLAFPEGRSSAWQFSMESPPSDLLGHSFCFKKKNILTLQVVPEPPLRTSSRACGSSNSPRYHYSS